MYLNLQPILHFLFPFYFPFPCCICQMFLTIKYGKNRVYIRKEGVHMFFDQLHIVLYGNGIYNDNQFVYFITLTIIILMIKIKNKKQLSSLIT